MPDSERGLVARQPNDHLNRRLLMKQFGRSEPAFALLELLCTDSVYVLKDDFDREIDPNVWETQNLLWSPDDPYGSLVSEVVDDDVGVLLKSRVAGWKPENRPVFQARVNFAPVSSPHFEMGFVSEDVQAREVISNITSSGVTRSDVPKSWALAVRDRTFTLGDSAAWYVAIGEGSDGSADVTEANPNPGTDESMTLMVSFNEGGDCRLWVNGTHDNDFANITLAAGNVNRGHHLWLYGRSGSYNLDYVQAWQERMPV